jgi:hypothetical protein
MGSGFRVGALEGLGLRVRGFRFNGSGFRVKGVGFRRSRFWK